MRFLIYGFGLWVVFTVFTTVFAASAPARQVRQFSKAVWVALCLLVPFLGGILYLIYGRPADLGVEPKTTRTIAPDDDPEFLRRLADELREENEDDEKND